MRRKNDDDKAFRKKLLAEFDRATLHQMLDRVLSSEYETGKCATISMIKLSNENLTAMAEEKATRRPAELIKRGTRAK